MVPPVQFAKLSGSGNDFICLDNRDGRFDAVLASADRLRQLAAALCPRGLSVGADGLIFACRPARPDEADIAARFIDPDGTEPELCGNGSACFARWVVESGWVRRRVVRIETQSGMVRGRIGRDSYVHACIPEPHDLETDIEVVAGGVAWKLDFAITGVPHVVAFVDDVDRVDVARHGAAIRHLPRFNPPGVCVSFAQVLGEGELALRTFEYGAETETLACGTGSATAALMAARRFGWPRKYLSEAEPIRVHARVARERFYRSGGQDWGSALFYSEFLARQAAEIRDWEPFTGMKTATLARQLGRSVDDLYDEFSPGDTWQLIGPSYVGDRDHHRVIGDLSVRETADFVREILGKAKEDMLRRFPQRDSQERLAEWFRSEESEIPARELGENGASLAGQAAQRLEAVKDAQARKQWQNEAFPDLTVKIEELEARRRQMAESSVIPEQMGEIWKRIKVLQLELLDRTVRAIARDRHVRELDYWDSRGALLPWSIALGGQGFYDSLIASAEIYEEPS